jgi:hypothetical protein
MQTRILAFVFLSILSTEVRAAKVLNLDAYIGAASFTSNGTVADVRGQAGASVARDRLLVPQVGEVFNRYVLRTPQMSQDNMADFTIYQASNGDLYSYFWDTAYLRSEESIRTDGGEFNRNSWVKLIAQDQTYSGIFYPGDIGEIRLSLRFDKQSITLTRSERGQIVVGPFPIPSPNRRTQTETFTHISVSR